MQCNPQYIVSGPPNCSQFYSFNPPYPPPPPCSPPYPDIMGEGEVKSVIFADGTVQFYFLPTSKWSPPYVQNTNSLNYNPYCHPTTGAWIIRSVPNSPPCSQFVPQPCAFPRLNYACNNPLALHSPRGVAMKFHNDNCTSTTDLQYFVPRMRKLMLTPQTCVGVQSDVNENSSNDTVCDKPCNCGPDCRNTRTPIFNGDFTKQKYNGRCCTKDATRMAGVQRDMSIDETKYTSSKRSSDNAISKYNTTTNNKPTREETRKKKRQSSISSAEPTESSDRKASISITCKCESEIRKTKQFEDKLRHKTEQAEQRRKEKELKTKQREQSKLDKKRSPKEKGRNSLHENQSTRDRSISSSHAFESCSSSSICSCCKDRHTKGKDKAQEELEKKQKKSQGKSKKRESDAHESQRKEQRLENESVSTESITTTSCSTCSFCGDRSDRQDETEKPQKDKESKKQMEKEQKQKKKELEKEQKRLEKEHKKLEKEQKHKEKSRNQSLLQEEKSCSQSQNHSKLSSELKLSECSEPRPDELNVSKKLENSESAMSVDGLDDTCNFCTALMESIDRNTRDVFSECTPPPTSDKLLATQNDQACSGMFATSCGLDFCCGFPIDLNDTKLVIDKDSVEISAQPLTNETKTPQKPGDLDFTTTGISDNDNSKTCIC